MTLDDIKGQGHVVLQVKVDLGIKSLVFLSTYISHHGVDF